MKWHTLAIVLASLLLGLSPQAPAAPTDCLDGDDACDAAEEVEKVKKCKWTATEATVEYAWSQIQEAIGAEEEEPEEPIIPDAPIGLCAWAEASLYAVDDSECENLGLGALGMICGHNDLTVGGDSQILSVVVFAADSNVLEYVAPVCQYARLALAGPWQGCSEYIGHTHWHTNDQMLDPHVVTVVAGDGPTSLTPIRAAGLQATYNSAGYIESGSWP